MNIILVILSALVSAFSRAPAQADIPPNEYPQGILNQIVTEHLDENVSNKEKKVLFIGYDGYRRDCLPVISSNENGAVSRISSMGSLLMTYAGGTKDHPQQTGTAVGWSTILTGLSSEESGVWNNKSVKRDSAVTFLTRAAKNGYSCAFISSYPSHFDKTLVRDIRKARRDSLSVEYIRTSNDEESRAVAISLLEEGTADVVFVIFEYTDAAGHSYGFSSDEKAYTEACRKADTAGAELVDVCLKTDSDAIDRLIVITTDHGGIGRRHGGQSNAERETWAAISHKLELENKLS